MIFRYIFCHSDLDLQPKVTNFSRVRASAISNYLAKPRPNRRVRSAGILLTDRQTHTHTHTQTNCNENITPPRFRGGVKTCHDLVPSTIFFRLIFY